MNNINQYNFDIIHVATHLRDTLEYVLPRDHDAKVFEQRKAVLTKGLEKETPLGKFLEANKDKFEKVITEYKEFLDEVYGDNSTILAKTSDGKIRVDHSQHIKIYKYVNDLMEPIRDVIYFHLNLARKQNQAEPIIEDLMKIDDSHYRTFAYMLVMQDFQKSFFEFQKVMGEAKGQPTPQSNYIVQNELAVMAGILRNMRSKTHCTDNKTLDTLDDCLKVIEMSEGRRDRIDDKPFPELFKNALENTNKLLTEQGPKWQELFNKALQEMLADIRKNTENKAQA
ncbi:MAG: hypothetical protein MJ225_01370 [Bacilli bacterium]|nr:hypothetical protein [Bacilli bacterium]